MSRQEVVHTRGNDNSVSTRVEKPKLSKTLRDYIEKSALLPKLDAKAPEHRRAELRRARDAGLIANVMQGYWLAEIQAIEGNDAFRESCADINVSKSAAYYLVAQFRLFNQFDDLDVVQALGSLEPSKFRALKFQPEEWTAFARGDAIQGVTLDAAIEMSQRDLEGQIKQWQTEHDDKVQKLEREKAQLKNQLELVTNQKNLMARAGAALQAEEDLPHFALVVRQESMALTEQMSFCLDNLQAVTDEHLFTEIKHPEAPRFQPIAANTCYFAVAGIVARGLALLDKLRGIYGEDIGEQLTLEHQFSAIELKRFVEAREQILAAHHSSAKRRDDDRENNKPGKRGAKRK